MTRIERLIAGLGCVLAMLSSGTALAQQQPPVNLSTLLASSTEDSALQASAGNAIQRTCADLAGAMTARVLSGTEQDLFQRCNELVETARAIQGDPNPANTDRSLGFENLQLFQTLQQYAGEELTAIGELSSRAPAGQFSNIGGRLNALRLGTSLVAGRGRVARLDQAENGGLGAGRLASSDPDYRSAVPGRDVLSYRTFLSETETVGAAAGHSDAPGVSNPWGWFADASYNFGDRDRTPDEDGFDFDAGSVTLGVDYNFGSSVLGASIGYDTYKADFNVFDQDQSVRGGEANVKGASASVFAAWFGELISFNLIASYGMPDSDIRRVVIYEPATSTCATCPPISRELIGSPDTSYSAFGATVEINGRLGSWDFTPSLSLNFRSTDVDGYTEREISNDGTQDSGLALQYGGQSIDSNRLMLGVALSRPISRSFGIVQPIFRAEYHHEFEGGSRTLNARFNFAVPASQLSQNPDDKWSCRACFAFVTDEADADFGVLGAGISFVFRSRMQAYVYAESLVGARNLTSNSVSFGIRGQF